MGDGAGEEESKGEEEVDMREREWQSEAITSNFVSYEVCKYQVYVQLSRHNFRFAFPIA